MAPLSICMVSDDFLPSATGVGTHLQQVCPPLVASGHRVAVVTTRRAGQPRFETWQGVEIHRVATLKVLGFYQGLPSAATLRAILREVQPDVIHYHYLGVMLLRALDAAERLGLPKVYTYHMTEDHLTQPLVMRPFRRAIARQIVACCNRMDLVISVSQTLAAELPRRGIRPPIRYISNPVGFPDESAVAPLPRAAPYIVMYAGRLNPEKNLPYLLRAFARLSRTAPESVLWIAGEGSQKGELQAQCRELGIGEQVEFLGFLSHEVLARRYITCDVFVLPSLVETQGLVAMEAMWFRKPLIVARSVVSATELVDDGQNGFIVDETSDADLAGRLAQLGADPGLREEMGAAGRRKAEAFRPERIVAALNAAYLETVGSFDRAPALSGGHR